MDFFRPGGFKLMTIDQDGKFVDLDSVPDFLTDNDGQSTPLCDCPPGVCLGDSEALEGDFENAAAFFAALFGEGPASDDIGQDDDMFADEEEVGLADRLEAVAQLGRITENLTRLAAVHAELLSDLLDT